MEVNTYENNSDFSPTSQLRTSRRYQSILKKQNLYGNLSQEQKQFSQQSQQQQDVTDRIEREKQEQKKELQQEMRDEEFIDQYILKSAENINQDYFQQQQFNDFKDNQQTSLFISDQQKKLLESDTKPAKNERKNLEGKFKQLEIEPYQNQDLEQNQDSQFQEDFEQLLNNFLPQIEEDTINQYAQNIQFNNRFTIGMKNQIELQQRRQYLQKFMLLVKKMIFFSNFEKIQELYDMQESFHDSQEQIQNLKKCIQLPKQRESKRTDKNLNNQDIMHKIILLQDISLKIQMKIFIKMLKFQKNCRNQEEKFWALIQSQERQYLKQQTLALFLHHQHYRQQKRELVFVILEQQRQNTLKRSFKKLKNILEIRQKSQKLQQLINFNFKKFVVRKFQQNNIIVNYQRLKKGISNKNNRQNLLTKGFLILKAYKNKRQKISGSKFTFQHSQNENYYDNNINQDFLKLENKIDFKESIDNSLQSQDFNQSQTQKDLQKNGKSKKRVKNNKQKKVLVSNKNKHNKLVKKEEQDNQKIINAKIGRNNKQNDNKNQQNYVKNYLNEKTGDELLIEELEQEQQEINELIKEEERTLTIKPYELSLRKEKQNQQNKLLYGYNNTNNNDNYSSSSNQSQQQENSEIERQIQQKKEFPEGLKSIQQILEETERILNQQQAQKQEELIKKLDQIEQKHYESRDVQFNNDEEKNQFWENKYQENLKFFQQFIKQK
ncbi:hypothetical protein PPERSA_10899 [Pseudocohnilembus persalinus]|uniref:Uncharacterized protein n=1 Tax=Pseudocohnilembus persalinus TaxID=266149 RepID=A0A0V0R9E8_PSEPJ|nr:hypothetical protein PPERSA_10899 [Pseudocohnilembus persalinus]|eukprot:KRX11132.1 hypothetical protein PPERSA_10899 [Pseudocohnilembus persalinus]